MKKKSLLLFVSAVCFSTFSYGFTAKVNRVVDGDTIEIIIREHPKEIQKIHIRLLGIDTPEKTSRLAQCPEEIELANKATERLSNLLKDNAEIDILVHGHDKYGGRALGTVFLKNRSNLNVNEWMISNNLAVRYLGIGPKHNWCQ